MAHKRRLIPFGQRIAACRDAAGLTQEDVAAAVGRTKSWLSRVENGKRDPSYRMVEKICAVLRTSVADLAAAGVSRNDVPVNRCHHQIATGVQCRHRVTAPQAYCGQHRGLNGVW